jgi:glycosyltransferase involved in cell wall biosynthesis
MKPVRLLTVIVLYKLTAAESTSYKSLLATASNVSPRILDLKILLYDNTPGDVPADVLPLNVEHHKALTNNGLADAYNSAAELAEEGGYDWLLTLDQDTILPSHFLSRLAEIIADVAVTPSVAAIVPQIVGDGRILSPNWFWYNAIARSFSEGYVGIPTQPVFAFNSAATIRVSALRQIGGYNPLFWLDSSDHEVFRQLHKFGKSVYVVGNIQVGHDFSMLSMEQRMSPERYWNVLLAESAFWDLEMATLAGIERTIKLAFRYFKQLLSKSDIRYTRISAEFLKRRLFWTKFERIAAWKRETLVRFPDLQLSPKKIRPKSLGAKENTKISVCMAAYNGEKYVEQQLRSILPQLGLRDEIIIVDDKSTDQTADIVLSIADSRIHLIRHDKNLGVITTFEDAIRNATGDVIFLADDDDIWAPDKVTKVLNIFRQDDSIQVISTGVSVIDQDGNYSADPIYLKRRRFRPGFWANILINHYQGSAMAFRSSLLTAILPLPKDLGFLHDVWIGTRNALVGGKSAYIDEPLLLYRRHHNNYSQKMSSAQRVKIRLQLLFAHALVGRNR